MNNDRYERIRVALEMGPTPGPFSTVRSYSSGNQELILSLTYKGEHGDEHGGIYCTVRNGLGDTWKTEVDAAYIAACDPDTIRALLDERDALVAENARLRGEPHPAITHCENCGCDWLDNGLNPVGCPYCKLSAEIEALRAEVERLRSADVEVVFIDGVGAGRSSVESCRNGVQWIRVGNRVYWPLADADAQRLQSACCGNGSFDGPTTPAGEGEQQ